MGKKLRGGSFSLLFERNSSNFEAGFYFNIFATKLVYAKNARQIGFLKNAGGKSSDSVNGETWCCLYSNRLNFAFDEIGSHAIHRRRYWAVVMTSTIFDAIRSSQNVHF